MHTLTHTHSHSPTLTHSLTLTHTDLHSLTLTIATEIKWNEFSQNLLSLSLSYGYELGQMIFRINVYIDTSPRILLSFFAFVILKVINSEIVLFHFPLISVSTVH